MPLYLYFVNIQRRHPISFSSSPTFRPYPQVFNATDVFTRHSSYTRCHSLSRTSSLIATIAFVPLASLMFNPLQFDPLEQIGVARTMRPAPTCSNVFPWSSLYYGLCELYRRGFIWRLQHPIPHLKWNGMFLAFSSKLLVLTNRLDTALNCLRFYNLF